MVSRRELWQAFSFSHIALPDDDTARYPKRFMLLGLVLFKNILPVLSSDHQHSKIQCAT